MGIIIKNQIQYTGGGSGGGGGTPVEIIDEAAMEELVDEGTYDPSTIYLIYPDDADAIRSIFYNGWYYVVGKVGSVNTEMSDPEWYNEVGVEMDEWNVTGLSNGWYFIYNDNADNTLQYIVHVVDAENNEFETPILNFSPSSDQLTHIMTQAQYDAILDDGGIPSGFSYCTDTRNFYYHDNVIVENTPPVP